ncbi:endonuclease/exonuclease/phosphatase family protein [Archangium gephyra]|uniref:Endonuclease/exonuclease/phosphatase family protein n=1 Tax=Archangium gephyra TaxID=48 RepID=A0AAC8TB23_9BACT|nr:endonuclease/exonuclease/phosphatase family protein [Archangium gephyra]AKI99172.1 Hypothetical protein AA314_00799 [Archangium gephyra]REG31077.1 endonuclease/exonuclease/phosphatase family protein [Archangium gephyra]
MSLWSPATRKAYLQRTAPKSSARTEPPQKPAARPATPQKPAAQLRFQDSFTPAPRSGGGSSRKLDLNPSPIREGYSEPIRPSEVPPARQGGTGILTLNTANGAGEQYNDPKNREAQAELIRQSGASIIGFQEVDVGLERSEGVNTALDVVARFEPGFSVFTEKKMKPVDIHHEPVSLPAIREGHDGTTLYQTEEGTLVTGESFSGDDRGGLGTSSTESTYGNAIYVAAPQQVTEAYTVALPSYFNVEGDGQPGSIVQGASPEELAALADGQLTPEERDRLGADNERLRDLPNAGNLVSSEPRSALVTRVRNPDGTEQTIINVHVAVEPEALRDAQLAYIAQLAAAESKGPPAREVVVMGDFNSYSDQVAEHFEAVGLEQVVGGPSEDGANIDQIWTTAGVNTRNSAQVETEVSFDPNPDNQNTTERETRDTTDHDYAGYTEIF